jgi:hypothetical protein
VPSSRPRIEQALIEGFGTTVFNLERDPDVPGTYVWQRMERAQYVQCALFICPPVVRSGAVRWIANFHECALSTQSFSLTTHDGEDGLFTFTLAGMSQNSEQSPCGATARATAAISQIPLITTLNLGCWASDSRQVLGSTALLAIDPAELPQFSRPVLTCGGVQSSEGELCVARRRRSGV